MMVTAEMDKIIADSEKNGWVMEPEAKRLLALAGLDVPRFGWARNVGEAVRLAEEIGYPVVGKVISPKVIHKSEVQGVKVGIENSQELTETFSRLSEIEGFAGMLVEEMHPGLELIVGARVDFQFGPVILLGMGGTGVEIYRDVALRMAPLEPKDVDSLVRSLKARPLLEGYRGGKPIRMEELTKLLLAFSRLVMELQGKIESIDLNPVICTVSRVVIADARIMLKK